MPTPAISIESTKTTVPLTIEEDEVMPKIPLRETNTPSKKNFHIALLGDSIEHLEWLQKRVGTGKQNEVFANALRLLEMLIKEHEKGSKFYIKRKNHDLQQYDLFESN